MPESIWQETDFLTFLYTFCFVLFKKGLHFATVMHACPKRYKRGEMQCWDKLSLCFQLQCEMFDYNYSFFSVLSDYPTDQGHGFTVRHTLMVSRCVSLKAGVSHGKQLCLVEMFLIWAMAGKLLGTLKSKVTFASQRSFQKTLRSQTAFTRTAAPGHVQNSWRFNPPQIL